MIKAIVTCDRNWAIGKNGRQITTIPEDVRFIRSTTTGAAVIMGRKTIETYLTAQIPANRTNIVLSNNPEYKLKGAPVETCTSIKEALGRVKELGVDAYVLGGASVFEQMLPYCDEVLMTWVDYTYDADCHFPNLDRMPEWVMVQESEEMTHFDTVYYLRKYVRRKDYKV